jgi:hypothetical protein
VSFPALENRFIKGDSGRNAGFPSAPTDDHNRILIASGSRSVPTGNKPIKLYFGLVAWKAIEPLEDGHP